MKSNLWLHQIGKIALIGTLLFGATIPLSDGEASAAVPKWDKIRVALFMNDSKSSLESSITLNSTSGFDIGIRNDKNIIELWTNTNASQIRTSADGYGVQLLVTEDLNRANVLAEVLSSPPEKAQVFADSTKGKMTYRVVYGHFMALGDAAAARDQVLKNASVVDLINGYSPTLTGTVRLSTPSYNDQSSAEKLQETIAKAGLSASVVMIPGSAGNSVYQVWVGNEPDKAALTKLQSEAAKLLPNISLQQANTNLPYVMIQTSAVISTTVPHYTFGANSKLWVHPKQTGVAVKERMDRKYRGDFEFSLYNNDLAVVNELPFEEYLYSVIGAEMGGSYPVEALKAQAVLSRTYAMTNGNTYDIVNVVDNTYDQAYYGMDKESDTVIEAVNATKGEIVVDQQRNPIATFYSASAGGVTADPSEVWKNDVPNTSSVQSPDDGGAEQWYRILLSDNRTGYVKGNYIRDTGKKNATGFSYYSVTENGLNVRTAPTMNSTLGSVITKLDTGNEVLVLESVVANSPYVWERRFDTATLTNLLVKSGTDLTGTVAKLEVISRGPSGRVTEVKANGQTVKAKTPDALRTVFGSLPSTLFDIVETGRYTIQGASTKRDKTDSAAVYTLSATNKQVSPAQSQYFVMGATPGDVRAVTADTQFLFKGKGYGHGLGLSQYGARNYALQGYTYEQIIQAYFNGVSITKG